MNEFVDIVKALMDEGLDEEDIKEMLYDAIDEATEEPEQTEREKYIEHIEDKFWEHVDEECLEKADVVGLAILVMADKHPTWEPEDFMEFGKALYSEMEMLENVVGKTPDELIEFLGKEIGKLFETRGRSREEKNTCSCGADRKNKAEDDKSVIERFLNTL